MTGLRVHWDLDPGNLSCLEKETATHSSVLAWRIPGMAEPGGFLRNSNGRLDLPGPTQEAA